MKGKLQKGWVLSSIILMGLTTTLPSVNTVLAETISDSETPPSATEKPTLPYDDLFTPPSTSSSETEEANVEEEPTFSLKEEQMTESVGKVIQVVILVDRPINQVQITIPQDLKVQQEDIPEGVEATQMTETEWWFAADESMQFMIPVLSETAGNYTLRIEDQIDGTVEFEESEEQPTEEKLETPKEQENIDEEKLNPELEEETPAQETEEVTPATTSNVSTWAQYRTAINTASVTEINVLADISGNTSLSAITRNLTINGNGYTINSQGQQYTISTANRQITVRNARLVTNRTGTSGLTGLFLTRHTTGTVEFRFSDISYSGTGTMITRNTSHLSAPNVSIVFDSGESRFESGSTNTPLFGAPTEVRIINDASVVMTNRFLLSYYTATLASVINRMSLTVERDASLFINNVATSSSAVSVNNLSVDGKLHLVGSGTTTSALSTFPVATASSNWNFGENSQVIIEQTTTIPVLQNGNTVSTNLIIADGAQFDLINSAGGPILNNTRSNNIQLATENLAVWNRGRTSSIPSQNYENIEAQLTGANAATITSTNHNVFRSTYSKQGLNGYSRISSSGIAGENPLDPLEPDKEIDPDNPPVIQENQGDFRLDFVSQFSFGEQERNMFGEETYYALPQYGLDSDGEVIESEPKPNFVQITDNRADADGWQLSVRQQEQFKTAEGNELSGASLQLKNRQLVADHDGQQPQEATAAETITLEPGAKQPLLSSSNGQGKGTWIYRFGDGTTSDQSVALVVPKETLPEATTYQTKLDWELQAIPSNE